MEPIFLYSWDYKSLQSAPFGIIKIMALSVSDKRGIFFALLGFSLFSIGDVFIKKLVDGGFRPAEIAFFLNLFYLPFMIVLSPVIGGIKATLRTEQLHLHVLRALLGIGTFIINVYAFQILGLALSYTLMFIAPFFVTLFSHFFLNDRVQIHRFIAIMIGFAGVLVVLQPWGEPLHPIAYLMVLSAFLIAAGQVLARKIGGDEPVLAFSLFGNIIGLQVFGVLVFWDGSATIPQGWDWLSFFIIACFHMVAILLTSKAFASTSTTLVAPFHYVQLLWGAAFGYFLFGSALSVWTILGAVLIVSGGIYMIHRERVRHQEINTGTTAHGGFEP